MSGDPFYSVKDEILGLSTKLNSEFSRFEALSSRSADSVALLTSIKQQISVVDKYCKDLSQTILIVENNRVRFPSISENELNSRKLFVTEVKKQLNSYQQQLIRSSMKTVNENRRDLIYQGSAGRSSKFTSTISSQLNPKPADYVSANQNQQQTLIKQQDLVLEDMETSLARLAGIGEVINIEFIDQGKMLNQLDSGLDETQGNMKIVLNKMDKLLKTSNRGRICCIIGLFFLIILFIILIIK